MQLPIRALSRGDRATAVQRGDVELAPREVERPAVDLRGKAAPVAVRRQTGIVEEDAGARERGIGRNLRGEVAGESRDLGGVRRARRPVGGVRRVVVDRARPVHDSRRPRVRKRVRAGKHARGELCVREDSLPHAEFIVCRVRVVVARVLGMSDVAVGGRDASDGPVGDDHRTGVLDRAGRHVAPHPADLRRAVGKCPERDGNMVRSADGVGSHRIVRREKGRVRLLDFDSILPVRPLAQGEYKVVLVVLPEVKETSPVLDAVVGKPHFHRHLRDVRGQHVHAKVERARTVASAAHHHGGVAVVEANGGTDHRGGGAADGIIVVAVEAPAVHQFGSRHGGSYRRARYACSKKHGHSHWTHCHFSFLTFENGNYCSTIRRRLATHENGFGNPGPRLSRPAKDSDGT